MSDLGPRRMDGMAPVARSGAVEPAVDPRPQPVKQAEVAPSKPAVASRPAVRAKKKTAAPAQVAEVMLTPKSGGGWKVAAQFVAGLLVIVAVAVAIVLLYARYYQ